MHRSIVGAAVCAVLALGGCEGGTQVSGPPTAEAVNTSDLQGIASVVDGDTIEIHGERIRLSGFDTPERGATCGSVNVYQRAANELDSFIAGRTVSCRRTGTDGERTVAICSVGGVDLGDHIVSRGWGRDWPRYSQGRYADEEQAARAASAGIWGLDCPADLWGNRDYSR